MNVRVTKHKFALIVFSFAAWLVLTVYYVAQGDYQALVLWAILPALFGGVFLVALRSGYVVLSMYMGVFCLLHSVLPPLFFIRRDRYTIYGWTAVKYFGFTLTEFAAIYWQVFLIAIGVLCASLLLHRWLFGQKTTVREFQRIGADDPTPRPVRHGRRDSLMFTVMLVGMITAAATLNNWMFQNGISLTGIQPPQLPFKLGGALHYLTRFGIPIIMFLFYMRTERPWPLELLMLCYGFFAGFSQVSRQVYVMCLLPVVFFALVDRRYVWALVCSTLFLLCYPLIGAARQFVYDTSVGRATANTYESVFHLIYMTVTNYNQWSVFGGLFGLLNRIDSPQGVILASQFDPYAVGGPMSLFKKFFLLMGETDSVEWHREWIGVVLPEGFACGANLTAKLMMISNGNWGGLLALCVLIAGFIVLGEVLVRAYVRTTHNFIVGLGFATVYTVFAYTLIGDKRLYGFIVMSVVVLLILRSAASQHLCPAASSSPGTPRLTVCPK